MKTGSLRRRVTFATLALLAIVLTGVIAAVTIAYRSNREQDLAEQLRAAGGEFEDTDLSESEDTDKDTDGPSETLPIDLPPPDPGYLARAKPWRPVHQRPARDQRRPTWKKWER